MLPQRTGRDGGFGHAAERGVPEPRGMATTEGDWWILVERKDDMLT